MSYCPTYSEIEYALLLIVFNTVTSASFLSNTWFPRILESSGKFWNFQVMELSPNSTPWKSLRQGWSLKVFEFEFQGPWKVLEFFQYEHTGHRLCEHAASEEQKPTEHLWINMLVWFQVECMEFYS